MAGVVTTAGLLSLEASSGIVGWLQSLTLHLYSNAHTPAVTDTIADYTESTWPGYASASLAGFAHTGIDVNNNDQYDCAAIAFTSTGSSSESVYGYYWTDGAGDVVAAEEAPAPFAMTGAGLTYTVTPSFYTGQLSGTP